MSRIGKWPVKIPSGVDVSLQGGAVEVKGPKGRLAWSYPSKITVKTEDGRVVCERPNDYKDTRALHGLVRAMINNMVTGVSDGFTRVLEIVGVGYRVQLQGNKLVFSLGYSHPVEMELPEGIEAEVDKKQTTLTLRGIDKQQLGQLAANIRALRPPDSYKGKGVRFQGEKIKLKAGKTGKK